MKKMWLMAAVVCAALMVSCGGGDKKSDNKKTEEKKEQQQAQQVLPQQVETSQVEEFSVEKVESASPADSYSVEQVEAAAPAEEFAVNAPTEVAAPVATSSVEAKAAELTNQMIAAMKAGNEEALLKISAEADAWFETLSEEDKAKADEISNQLARAAGLM